MIMQNSKRKNHYRLPVTDYRLLSQGGFTLIEILVSLAIFVLIIGGVVLFSVRTIQAHIKSQAMQGAIENARYAIEAINKKIRTSHDITDGGSNDFDASDEVFIVDNVDAAKYCYRFNGGNLEAAKIAPEDAGYSAANDCSSFGEFSGVVGGSDIGVSGNFYVKNTDGANNRRGFVRTVINIQYNDPAVPPAERDSVTIQSSVSVRDY